MAEVFQMTNVLFNQPSLESSKSLCKHHKFFLKDLILSHYAMWQTVKKERFLAAQKIQLSLHTIYSIAIVL